MITADFWVWVAVMAIVGGLATALMLKAYLGSSGFSPLFMQPVDLPMDLPVDILGHDPEVLSAFNKGSDSFRAGRYRWAMDKYSQAIQLAPGLAQAYHNRGLLAANLRQNKEAAADLVKASEIYFSDQNKAALSLVREHLESLQAGKPGRQI
jgi:tetratricopeptide (TPR) repeat protein